MLRRIFLKSASGLLLLPQLGVDTKPDSRRIEFLGIAGKEIPDGTDRIKISFSLPFEVETFRIASNFSPLYPANLDRYLGFNRSQLLLTAPIRPYYDRNHTYWEIWYLSKGWGDIRGWKRPLIDFSAIFDPARDKRSIHPV